MSSTWIDLAQSLIGLLAFAVFVLPTGYLASWIVDPATFRDHSPAEQALWSIALGLPLTTLATASLLRDFAPSTVGVFVFCTLVAGLVLLRSERHRAGSSATKPLSPAYRFELALVCLIGMYPLLAVTDLQLGHRLFISTVMSDWAVRVPIVNAVLKAGTLPPSNPLSALTGTAPTLHYYYYWYVLCAQVARSAHISGRAALTASCAWAGYALVAILFLALKYLLGIRAHLRKHWVTATLLLPVIGLDILPVSVRLLVHREHPDFEIEWWREDRTPSLLSTILYAPHHIAGIAFALAGFLVLVGLLHRRLSPARNFLFAALVSACFAATAGTSTYVAFLFAVICIFWSVELVRSREWRVLAILAISGVLALALSRSYLHELITTSSGNQIASGSRGAVHFAVLRLRNQHFADVLLRRRHVQPHSAIANYLVRRAGALVLGVFELGFFLFVFARQLARDLRRGTLAAGERAMWALLLGAALPAIFLSSAVVSSANDLGLHAGILVRLTLLLWATPWIYGLWQNRRSWRTITLPRKLFLAAAALTLALGLGGQVLQMVFERSFLTMVETGVLHKRLDILTSDRLSYRLYNIRAAYQALDRTLPANAIVQFDPGGRMLLAMALYSNRQIAALDDGCGTGFGGDLSLCEPVYLRLRTFYGLGPRLGVESLLPLEDRGSVEEPVAATSVVSHDAEFRGVCRDLHLSAILIDSMDPEWRMPDSWVWTEPAFFSSETARAYLCPGSAGEAGGRASLAAW